jgi:hypothetical protein
VKKYRGTAEPMVKKKALVHWYFNIAEWFLELEMAVEPTVRRSNLSLQ